MSDSGAKAALKGYRLQALYTLAAIFAGNEKDLVFQPEGTEDLAVLKNGKLTRAIQIKAYKESLTLSSFSPEKPESFFHRAIHLIEGQNVSVEVVSFGPIGPEIEGARKGDLHHRNSVRTKLLEHGINDRGVELLFSCIGWQKVSEEVLLSEVFQYLRGSLTGGDPEHAFNLLVSWLYQAAEKRTKITFTDLRDKINAVGQYLAERAAHYQEWFTSIEPITEKEIDAEHREHLAEEFYRGVASRYSHIAAGLDVLRESVLNEIDSAFRSAQTVIVHGASGQGKTTIAYRYLHDYVPDEWRFVVRFINDRSHAARVAAALAEHLRVVNAPMYVYIEVAPKDLEWTALVRDLLDHRNIRILVTIREEDLARQTISDAELGFPHDIALSFDKDEATVIYERLMERDVAQPYPSFEEAWTRFGGQSPLLEYVYFITQTESLRARLAAQVRRLREEVRSGVLEPGALELLHSCAIATAYEARVEISSLVQRVGLKDPIGTLELFEREYLLRQSPDERYVEALHPVRSEILSDELTDPTLAPWISAAERALPNLPEADLETFLLYSFSRHQTEAQLLTQHLGKRNSKTWTGIAGVGHALLWLGIREYIDSNIEIITEVQDLGVTDDMEMP